MINPFSLFKRTDVNLSQKWWHRLFVVLYFVLLTTVVGAAGIGHFQKGDLVKERSFNITITSTWEDYTDKQSDGFSEAQKKQYNTYRAGGMTPEDAKRLAETPSFSSFVSANNDKVGCFSKNGSFQTLSEYTSDTVRENICDGNSSVSVYSENLIYHVQGIIYIILLVLFWALAVQLLYYKVFLYITFGPDKKTYQ